MLRAFSRGLCSSGAQLVAGGRTGNFAAASPACFSTGPLRCSLGASRSATPSVSASAGPCSAAPRTSHQGGLGLSAAAPAAPSLLPDSLLVCGATRGLGGLVVPAAAAGLVTRGLQASRRGGARGLSGTTAAAAAMQGQQQPPPLTAPPSGSGGASGTAEGADAAAVGRVRVAVGQMTACGDQAANLAVCSRLAQDAAAAGCTALFLPECFSFIGESPAQSLAAAQPLEGPLMSQYRQLARDTGLWLSLGGFQEAGPDPQHIYNTHVVVDAGGNIAAAYRKIHLFDVDVPNGPLLMESRTTAPGSEALVVDTPAGRLGLTTCYDLRFPELFAHLAWERGAQVLAVPSAFTVITGAAHWEVLLRARAIECQAYVVAAAQAGRHNAKRESYGHAIIVDPWGTVIARLPDPAATGIAVADLELGPGGLLAATRQRMPCQQHRAKGRAAYAAGAGAGAGAGAD